MKIKTPKCPECGLPAKGTLDSVLAIARFSAIGPDGSCEYEGGTEILWNTQETLQDLGQLRLICPNGHDWASPVEGV
ncbi:MAG: hypothetical protein ACREIC_22095 [Limisphaerales bacterium]